MTYSIIGSGNVGTALARQFARAGIRVGIANTRGPETLLALADDLGGTVTAQALGAALAADVVILAIPFLAHKALTRHVSHWNDRIVIDAMNTYGIAASELGDRASSDIVAAALPGARVVKTFNQLPAALLAQSPSQAGGRRVMFVASNHDEASEAVVGLVDKLGFAPIALGRIAEGGRLLERGAPLVLQNLIKQDSIKQAS